MKKSWNIIRCYLFIVIALVVCLLLFGCKTQYVPIVEHHTEVVHDNDTVKDREVNNHYFNTILRESRPEDSAMIAQLGIKLKANERLLILMQQQIAELNKEKYESHNKDSVRVDSVPVPVPVAKQLGKWEQFTLDYGKVAFGGTLVAVALVIFELVRWLRRRDK